MDLKDNLAEMTVICETIETVMRFLQIKKEPAKKKLKEYVENDLIIVGKLKSEKVVCIMIRKIKLDLLFYYFR